MLFSKGNNNSVLIICFHFSLKNSFQNVKKQANQEKPITTWQISLFVFFIDIIPNNSAWYMVSLQKHFLNE